MQAARHVFHGVAFRGNVRVQQLRGLGLLKYSIPVQNSITFTHQRRHQHLTSQAEVDDRAYQARETSHDTSALDIPEVTINGQTAWYGEPEGLYISDYLALNWVYLRDACQCPVCVDPSTRQRSFTFADIPMSVRPRQMRCKNGQVEIIWQHNYALPACHDNTTILPEKLFAPYPNSLGYRGESHNYNWTPKPWTREGLEMDLPNLTLNFSDYMNSKATLFQAVQKLLAYGLVFIKDVPTDEGSVRAVSDRVGPIRNSFYGETWDVKSKPSAINVAYTSKNLGFHQDLLYMAEPPFLQFLHVMKASTSGGHSLFSDTINTFQMMQKEDALRAMRLNLMPITYQYRNNEHFYEHTRHMVEGRSLNNGTSDPDSKVSTSFDRLEYPRDYEFINYSPPFQGPFQTCTGINVRDRHTTLENLRQYHNAARRFKKLLESPESVFETKLEEATCVIFNNRRIVHARTRFESTEDERWLRGAYVDRDPFMSLYRTLDEENRQTGGSLDPGKFEEDRTRPELKLPGLVKYVRRGYTGDKKKSYSQIQAYKRLSF